MTTHFERRYRVRYSENQAEISSPLSPPPRIPLTLQGGDLLRSSTPIQSVGLLSAVPSRWPTTFLAYFRPCGWRRHQQQPAHRLVQVGAHGTKLFASRLGLVEVEEARLEQRLHGRASTRKWVETSPHECPEFLGRCRRERRRACRRRRCGLWSLSFPSRRRPIRTALVVGFHGVGLMSALWRGVTVHHLQHEDANIPNVALGAMSLAIALGRLTPFSLGLVQSTAC